MDSSCVGSQHIHSTKLTGQSKGVSPLLSDREEKKKSVIQSLFSDAFLEAQSGVEIDPYMLVPEAFNSH